MKKLLSAVTCLSLMTSSFFVSALAGDLTVIGKGSAALSGYDINATRSQEDEYMNKKANNSKTEFMHSQQIKEASRQAEKRKKEDKRMSAALRSAVITTARERADKDAANMLLIKVLGNNALNNPNVKNQLDNVYSQIDALSTKTYTGEVIDNKYIAKVNMVVDDGSFRQLVSDLGISINSPDVRTHSILVVMDEFFTQPSDLHSNVLTKEVTTYDYKYNEKDKQTTKASYKDSNNYNNSAAYGSWYGGGRSAASGKSATSANYGNFVDYSQNESEFFQNIKEYAPKNPQAQNINYTQPALVEGLNKYDLKTIDNDVFKSKFFKGKAIASDQLKNSEQLEKYVKYAQTDAKADFFAIGVSYIVDNGKNPSTGMRTCDGQVDIKVYSTQDGELIAAGSITETAEGNSADQARLNVANKIGQELGEALSIQVQNYYKKRNMNGFEYTLEVKGNFLPIERININKALKTVNGIQTVSLKSFDSSKIEYTLIYKGEDPVGDNIFMQLIEVSPKFNNYNYTFNRNQLIFEPLKGNENL